MIGWGVSGGVLISFLLFLARHTERTSIDSRRLVAEGTRIGCTVLDKRVTGGKSKSYYVRLSVDAPPYRPPLERSISRGAWEAVGPGSKSIWYHYPEQVLEGFSELERPSRESMAGCSFSLTMIAATLIAVVWALRFLRTRMRLLSSGVELRVNGDGRLLHGSRDRTVRLPHPRENYARLRSGAFVALADPDLSRIFLPELRDVPLDRLLENIPAASLVLPTAPRAPRAAWERWIRRRNSGIGWTLGITVFFGLCGLGGLLLSGSAGGVAITAVACVVGALLLLHWRRDVARLRSLWQQGREIHAAVLRTNVVKGTVGYELASVDGGRELRFTASLPRNVALWEIPGEKGGRVPLRRVVVLVDPDRPLRGAVVPFDIGAPAVS
jgi:hypothetical protein